MKKFTIPPFFVEASKMGQVFTSFSEKVTVLFHITRRCNLRCKHCFINADSSSKDDIPHDKIIEAVKDLKELKINLLAFTGGEPTLRQDFVSVLEETNKAGLKPCFVTNGTLITDDYARKLDGLVSEVLISIDGPREFHDSFRGVHGAFDKAVRGVESLKKHSVPFSLQFTLTKKSWDYVDWIAELASSLGAQSLKLEPLFEVGRGGELGGEYALDDVDLQYLNEKVMKLHGKYLGSTSIYLGAYSTKELISHPCNAYACSGHDCHRKATKEPRELIIMPDGLILPLTICIDKSFALGNVNSGRLLDIVRNYMESPRHERFINLCKYVFQKHVQKYPFSTILWGDKLGKESASFPALNVEGAPSE